MTAKKNPEWAIPENFLEEFAKTEFVVDASHDEHHEAWWKWSQVYLVPWEEVSRGYASRIGTVAGRPITASVLWAWIDYHLVAFVEGVSQLVDHEMLDEWKDAVFPCLGGGTARRERHADMANFGHCISFCVGPGGTPRSWNDVRDLVAPEQDTSWHGPTARRRRGAR